MKFGEKGGRGFGSIVNSFIKRKQYYYYTQKVGGKYIIIVVIIIVVYSCFLPEGMKNAQSLVIYMCLGLYSFYMLETMRSYFRIVNLNRTYSKLNVYNSVILLLLTVCLTLFFKNYGYITALILSTTLQRYDIRKAKSSIRAGFSDFSFFYFLILPFCFCPIPFFSNFGN